MGFLSGCLRSRASTWGVAIRYFDNILHACLCSVTLRKRINNRLLLMTFCTFVLAASPCGKSIASPIQTATAVTSCMLGVQRHLVETYTHMWKSALVFVNGCSHWGQACQEVGPGCSSMGIQHMF